MQMRVQNLPQTLHLHLRQRRALMQGLRINQLWASACDGDSADQLLLRGRWLQLVQGLSADVGSALDPRDAELRWLRGVQGSGGQSSGGMHFREFVAELLQLAEEGLVELR